MISICVTLMILLMKRCSCVQEMCHRDGMICMITKVMVLMASRSKRCLRKMNSKSLWKSLKILNGGEILLMNSIISRLDCPEVIWKCFCESGKAKWRTRISSSMRITAANSSTKTLSIHFRATSQSGDSFRLNGSV